VPGRGSPADDVSGYDLADWRRMWHVTGGGTIAFDSLIGWAEDVHNRW